MLFHPGPHTPGCLGKISLENKSISLCRLYATLNIKLNPCSTSQGHGSETVHHLQTSDMASQFLHCQQCGPFLIGTNDLQVCPWAIGLLLGQLLCLPAREDSEWDASEFCPQLCPPDPLLGRTGGMGQPVSLLAPSSEDHLSASAGWNDRRKLRESSFAQKVWEILTWWMTQALGTAVPPGHCPF